MKPDTKMKAFIILDPANGEPPRDEQGNITTYGIVGAMREDNAYLTMYAKWPTSAKAYTDLEVGESIKGVIYSLSGGRGVYDVWRVM